MQSSGAHYLRRVQSEAVLTEYALHRPAAERATILLEEREKREDERLRLEEEMYESTMPSLPPIKGRRGGDEARQVAGDLALGCVGSAVK